MIGTDATEEQILALAEVMGSLWTEAGNDADSTFVVQSEVSDEEWDAAVLIEVRAYLAGGAVYDPELGWQWP